jgi:hypothetical protein
MRGTSWCALWLAALAALSTSVVSCAEEEGKSANGKVVWATSAGGSHGEDNGAGIVALSDGSSLVTGAFSGSSTFGAGEANETTLEAGGLSGAFVAKYAADGSLAWVEGTIGSGGKSFGGSVAALSDGSSLVTGAFSGSSTFGTDEENETPLTSAGAFANFFLAKYGADGTLAWAKRAGGPDGDTIGNGICALADDSAVVVGRFSHVATFGAGEANETTFSWESGAHVFVAKYGADGALIWAKSPDQSDGSMANGNGVCALADGSTLVTGAFENTATFGAGERNETALVGGAVGNFFLAKYEVDGTLAWAKAAVGDNTQSAGLGVSALADGSAYVTGYLNGTMTFGAGEANEITLDTAGAIEAFIARYEADGTLAWARASVGYYGNGHGVCALADGSAMVTGSFDGMATFGAGEANETTLVSGNPSENVGNVFVARYGANGALTWAWGAEGSSEVFRARATGIVALSDGSALVTGSFGRALTFGASGTVLTSSGGKDIFVVKLAP